MKRGFRITLWILAAIVILLLALVVAVQSPTVQTALARKAITMLSDKIDGDITVGRISIRPFDAITLDPSPSTTSSSETGRPIPTDFSPGSTPFCASGIFPPAFPSGASSARSVFP